jgi:hypothetical protein
MRGVVVLLLLGWLVVAVLGVVLDGLLWLPVIGLGLVVATAVWGWYKVRAVVGRD